MIIVIGRGHSGTRVIAKVLQESGIFIGNSLNDSLDLIPPESMYEAVRIFSAKVEQETDFHWKFKNAINYTPEAHFFSLVKEFTTEIFDCDNDKFRGFKLPETTLCFPWITKIFPDAYYIYIVRDPKDSITGAHLTDDLDFFSIPHRHFNDVFIRRVISWKYHYDLVEATPRPSRFIQIRFEDLILDHDRMLESLEKFLDMQLKRIAVNTSPIGRWKNVASRIGIASTLVRKEMEELGYLFPF